MDAFNELESIINKFPNNAEWYIRMIYFLHNYILEVHIRDNEINDLFTWKLLDYFNISKNKFINNSDYQFFIWKILYIAERFFELNDDVKNIEDRLAYKMQRRALDLDKHNELFHWAVLISEWNISKANALKNNIINNNSYMNWLENYWFPWEYIINSLNFKY
jgi:hypothetical protein